jgi:hypothetical protein
VKRSAPSVRGPPARTCATCGRRLAPGAPYYRFALVLEAEQDVLDPPQPEGSAQDTEEALARLMKRLEDAPESPEELEAQVHWKHEGAVCPPCREAVVRMLAVPPEPAGSH